MSNDITMHNDSELSDIFDNDEYLYNQARVTNRFSDLEDLANEFFTFTPDQLAELKTDYEDGRWS